MFFLSYVTTEPQGLYYCCTLKCLKFPELDTFKAALLCSNLKALDQAKSTFFFFFFLRVSEGVGKCSLSALGSIWPLEHPIYK